MRDATKMEFESLKEMIQPGDFKTHNGVGGMEDDGDGGPSGFSPISGVTTFNGVGGMEDDGDGGPGV